jgi:non-ribosomal peptide synthetase component F
MTLLAAFKVLLYRYTGEEDLVVGTPIAGRNRAEFEGLIGFFINSLVLRTKLSGNPRFVEVLKRVREVTLGAYEHQDLPFEKLVEELQPERSLSHAPLFQVVFSLQNAPTMAATPDDSQPAPDTSDDAPQVHTSTSKFDLTVSAAEMGKNLMGTFEYNTDLFEATTIERMIDHYRRLLEAVVDNPVQRLSDIRLITDTETGGAGVSDFPDADLSQMDFESLVESLRNVEA